MINCFDILPDGTRVPVGEQIEGYGDPEEFLALKARAEAAASEVERLKAELAGACDACDEGCVYTEHADDDGRFLEESAESCPACNGTGYGWVAELRRDRDRLRTALVRYGHHETACTNRDPEPGEDCPCGYLGALYPAALRGPGDS